MARGAVAQAVQRYFHKSKNDNRATGYLRGCK
jgi:hypothetical protein